MVHSEPVFKVIPIQKTNKYSYLLEELGEIGDNLWENLYNEYISSSANLQKNNFSLQFNKEVKEKDFNKTLEEKLWN